MNTYFKYPQEVRRLIYITNAIEGFNRQLRKVTKSKSVFPTDDSLFKMLYLAMMDITKKWAGLRQDRIGVLFMRKCPYSSLSICPINTSGEGDVKDKQAASPSLTSLPDRVIL